MLCEWGCEKLFTVELGVLVPYPEEGKDAKDHRRPSLQRTHARHQLKTCRTQKAQTRVRLAFNCLEISLLISTSELILTGDKTLTTLSPPYNVESSQFQQQ